MKKYTLGQATTSLGHAMLWTKIFEYLHFDLSQERAVTLGKENAITQKNINQMRRGGDKQVDEGGEDEGEAAGRDVHMEDVLPPPEGFQDLRTEVTEGFLRLKGQICEIDSCLTRQVEEIHSLRGAFLDFHEVPPRTKDQG
ncbi:hypothetical protein PIB30_078954 [Stylosanthes scabra]|uniref:Uncharacterized protein n=1 Tax=Stylosanthes scabra TaxID=79078 RepID=A0ABU6XPK8_9FABA|nr:hypothetical protein [Stylosanthes scabra]